MPQVQAAICDLISDDFPVSQTGLPGVHRAFHSELAWAKAPAAAKPFERFDRCTLEPDEWTDGDSFRVRLPDGRLETFRLYYNDTTESRSRGKRSDEQAAYFGITHGEAVELGKVAKEFTARALAKPFTIQTRWRAVFGPSRYYSFVFTADGEDLAELLVRNGLARIYGTRTPLPDGRDSRQYLAALATWEEQAKSARLGGWHR
jgi:endonuclease YncB( thermonuclease family)